MNVRHFHWRKNTSTDTYHETAVVNAGKHRIEVTESPTGRSVFVHIDGECVFPVRPSPPNHRPQGHNPQERATA